MKKRILAIFLCFCLSAFLGGCYEAYELNEPDTSSNSLIIFTDAPTEQIEKSVTETQEITQEETGQESEGVSTISESQEFDIPEDTPLPESVEKDGSYTTPEDVAEYIHTFGTLPDNFITKKEAQKLGWDSSQGNLWDVALDKSIGGDYFGNREGILPDGNYHECDVNYQGGYRGAERIIYSDDGRIYYTNDHYKTFTQLY